MTRRRLPGRIDPRADLLCHTCENATGQRSPMIAKHANGHRFECDEEKPRMAHRHRPAVLIASNNALRSGLLRPYYDRQGNLINMFTKT